MRFDYEYRGIAPTDVDAWERTVAIYRVARKAGARLRARDLIRPEPEKWWNEWAGPLLNRIANVMHEKLEVRIARREIALGLVQEAQEEHVEQFHDRGFAVVDMDGNEIRRPHRETGNQMN